jgi:hypothetical protein
MIPNPYFSEQICSDHQQALLEEADTHRLLKQQAGPSTWRRRLGRPLRFTRRVRELLPTRATAPSPVPNAMTAVPDVAVPLGLPDQRSAVDP